MVSGLHERVRVVVHLSAVEPHRNGERGQSSHRVRQLRTRVQLWVQAQTRGRLPHPRHRVQAGRRQHVQTVALVHVALEDRAKS